MQKNSVFLVFFTAFLLCSMNVTAQDKDLTIKQADSIMNAVDSKKYPRYKFTFYTGGLFSNLDGSIIVNGKTAAIGTKLDFEDNLGLTSYITTFRLGGNYNISSKSFLTGSFLVMNRNSSIILTDSVKFGDYKYKANAKFDFLLNFTYLGLNYGYNFIAKHQFTAGATIGLRLFRIRTSGSGSVSDNNHTESASFEETLLAPGILFGLNNSVYFLPKLYGRSSMEYFSLKIGDIKASLFEVKMGLEYYFFKNLGVGIASLAYVLKINSESQDELNGQVLFDFKGLSLYLAARF